MSIVATEIVSSVTNGNTKVILYRCTDSEGGTHDHGPVVTMDANFDADAHKATVAVQVASVLAEREASEVLD